jgi:molybdopterin synthase sulfur carrier subunit
VREAGGAALTVTVRLAAALRSHAGGASRIELDVAAPATVVTVLDALAATHPAVARRVRDEAGGLRRHVNVFVGADNARDLDGLATAVADGTELTILPAVSGG